MFDHRTILGYDVSILCSLDTSKLWYRNLVGDLGSGAGGGEEEGHDVVDPQRIEGWTSLGVVIV